MKEDNALVTIVVPVYNVEKYLNKCLTSIINQDYANKEIILIDDGSKDNSLIICKEFQKKYKNIKVIEQENLGVSVARNKGIEKANGDWICFVDSDDYMEPNMISKMIENTRKEDFDILITPPIMEFESKSKKNKIFEREMDFTSENKENILLNIVCRQYGNNYNTEINAGGPWGKLYNLKFLKDNNLKFIVGLKRMQDVVFNLYAVNAAKRIIYREEFLYHYRINASSVCLKYNPTIFKTFSEVIDNIMLFAKENKKDESFYQAIYLKTILLYIEGSRISIIHKDNHDSIFCKIRELKKIYNQEIYINAFSNIKKKELNFKLKLFRMFVRLRLFLIVYILIKVFDKTKDREQR